MPKVNFPQGLGRGFQKSKPFTTRFQSKLCEDRVRDGPASGGKGFKGRNWLDCIRGKRRKGPYPCFWGCIPVQDGHPPAILHGTVSPESEAGSYLRLIDF